MWAPTRDPGPPQSKLAASCRQGVHVSRIIKSSCWRRPSKECFIIVLLKKDKGLVAGAKSPGEASLARLGGVSSHSWALSGSPDGAG